MKKKLKNLIALILLFISTISFAQLAMKLSIDNQSYIKYEQINAILSIKNQSGIPIVFGDNKKLSAIVKLKLQRISGEVPKSTNTKSLTIKNVIIKPGEQEEFSIPVSDYYSFNGEGRYKIKAIVSHPQLNSSFQTNYIEFNIIKYDTVWSTTVGIPEAIRNDNEKVHSIKYSVISYFDGNNKIYCLLVEDKDFVYSVNQLGYNIGTGVPDVAIDKLSKIHILVQNGTKIYTYFVYGTNGKLETKEIYRANEGSKIKIITNPTTGRMIIIGGTKANSGTDYDSITTPIKTTKTEKSK